MKKLLGEKIMAKEKVLKTIGDIAKKKDAKVDLHTHSTGSDGIYQVNYLMWMASGMGLDALAVTDHNTTDAVVKYLKENGEPVNTAYFKSNSTFFVPGVEVTCRVTEVPNKKGNSTKVHILLYGCDWSEDSPISKLLKMKAENDRLVDLGKLDYVLSKVGMGDVVSDRIIKDFVNQKRAKIEGYNTLSNDDISEFFMYLGSLTEKEMGALGLPNSKIAEIQSGLSSAGLRIKSNKGLNTLNRKLHSIYDDYPSVQRLNLDAKDVIECAHASGGIAVFAHPWCNMPRTIHQNRLVGTLLNHGLDGFEIGMENNTDEVEIIKSEISRAGKDDDIIYTAGSDTHNFNKGITLGLTGKGKAITVSKPRFGKFFEWLDERQKAVERGDEIESNISDKHVENILDRYAELSKDCIEAKPIKNVIQKEKHKEPKQKQKTKRVEDMTPEELAQFEEKRRRDLENASKSKPKNEDLLTIHLKSGKSFMINAVKTPADWLRKIPHVFFTPEELEAVAEFLESDRSDESMLERVGVLNPNNAKMNTPPTNGGYGDGM